MNEIQVEVRSVYLLRIALGPHELKQEIQVCVYNISIEFLVISIINVEDEEDLLL